MTQVPINIQHTVEKVFILTSLFKAVCGEDVLSSGAFGAAES